MVAGDRFGMWPLSCHVASLGMGSAVNHILPTHVGAERMGCSKETLTTRRTLVANCRSRGATDIRS